MRRPAEQRCRLAGFEDLRTHEGAVDEYGELAGKLVRTRNPQSLGDPFQPLAHLALVRGGNLAGRMIDLREFRRHVDLRAAAVIRAPDTLADPLKMGVQFSGWLVAVPVGDAIPGSPEILIFALEKSSD